MNDEGYIKETFKGSMNETSINGYTKEQLENMLPYYTGAVEYHRKEQNPRQARFFQDGAELIQKRLKKA